ncbi:MAG: UDP-N-acetylmuramoyl-tripeptide--D-alanyl-D-alanine ligase [Actinomycetota bacterium]
MIGVTLAEIAAILGASSQGFDADAMVTGVRIDSRQVQPGDLFIAIKGERSDGARFVDAALEAGAVAAVTTDEGPNRITVSEPENVLWAIAGDQRVRTSATVIAITGSAGKTLTKDLLAAALATQCLVKATRANMNNEFGVPLTICSVEEDTDALVVEVGARGVGHIEQLMPLVRPDVSVVLNVGSAHVGEFGGLERTALAKSELVRGLGPDGVAVLNLDDPRTSAMRELAQRVITFGEHPDAQVRMTGVRIDESGRAELSVLIEGTGFDARLPLPGAHLASNALAALAVVWELGLDVQQAADALATATTTSGRMQIYEVGGRSILDDSYNASPESMAAGLKTLATFNGRRPTWAVLGAMLELGDRSLEEHDRIGRLATRLGISRLIVVGDAAAPILHAARHEGMSPEDATGAADIDDALGQLQQMPDGAVILVKASRSVGLDRIVTAITRGDQA